MGLYKFTYLLTYILTTIRRPFDGLSKASDNLLAATYQPVSEQCSSQHTQVGVTGHRIVVAPGADLTAATRAVADEAPGRLGLGGPRASGEPGRANFVLQLQSPDCNLN